MSRWEACSYVASPISDHSQTDSESAMVFDITGWVIASCCAALAMLPASATAISISNWRSLRRRLVCAVQDMAT